MTNDETLSLLASGVQSSRATTDLLHLAAQKIRELQSECSRLGRENSEACDTIADLRAEVSRLRDVGAALLAPPCGPTAGPEDVTGSFPPVFP